MRNTFNYSKKNPVLNHQILFPIFSYGLFQQCDLKVYVKKGCVMKKITLALLFWKVGYPPQKLNNEYIMSSWNHVTFTSH